MATMMRCKPVSGVSRASRSRVVRCEAGLRQVQLAGAAALATAALMVSPADAGVVLQQPALKKAFDAPAAAAPAATPAAKAAAPKAAKKEVSETSEGGLDPRFVALPASVIFVGGLGFAASKVDEGFNEFIDKAVIRDSNQGQLGVGYENVIKSTAGGIYGPPERSFGTTKVAAKKGKGGGFFGKK